MVISCCSWALSGSEKNIIKDLSTLGLRHVDFRPFDFTSDQMQAYLFEMGLQPTCMAAAFGMPDGVALDSSDHQKRKVAIEHTKKALDYAEKLNIKRAYILPGENSDKEYLARYKESALLLADHASSREIYLCIEHFPGKALPSASATLDFIEQCNHENLYLLFDIGHAQISKESPVEVIQKTGRRLGYVHLDDNNGKDDLHLPLFEGVLTKSILRNTLTALKNINYDGPLSIEMHPTLPNPLEAIQSCFTTLNSLE